MASDRSMLEVARYNIAVASLETRIQLHHADAKSIPLEDAMFDTVLSNSLIHHVPEPAVIVAQIARLTKPGGRIFVRDLYRPDTLAEIDDLVERIVGQEAAEAQSSLSRFLARRSHSRRDPRHGRGPRVRPSRCPDVQRPALDLAQPPSGLTFAQRIQGKLARSAWAAWGIIGHPALPSLSLRTIPCLCCHDD